MNNIYKLKIPKNTKNLTQIIYNLEKEVKNGVLFSISLFFQINNIIDKCNSSHSKYIDNNFGPNKNDKNGIKSLYKNGEKPNDSEYSDGNDISWLRPAYLNSSIQSNEKYVCNNAVLYDDINNLSRYNQGCLGDGWLMNTISLLLAQPLLIEKIFYLPKDMIEKCKKYGFWVCRFFDVYYLIIE